MERRIIAQCLQEAVDHLNDELLPFWLKRCKDETNGGFITQFDQDGRDTGEDAKSLIAQARCTYTFSSAHRAGYGGGQCAEFARHGAEYLISRMWDADHGGFFWMTDRKGNVTIDKKVVYGQSFAIYALSEYTLATGDPRGLDYAQKAFDLLQKHAADTQYGGYFEMFDADWTLCGPGSAGGDRKTLDAHMHLMEAFTTLYECSRNSLHRRKLLEVIRLVMRRILHPQYRTGIPQYWADWTVAPQIKFDIIWGWDRFVEGDKKANPTDNTSYGHNLEMAWLLLHALDILGMPMGEFEETIHKAIDHAVRYGIDRQYGGVFVEGSHNGPAWDLEKEFWQQAEALIGLLDATLRFGSQYWEAYEKVHRFVFDKMIHHSVGEWWPLMNRDGSKAIWTHMSHSWKINYHTVRSMIQSIRRLEQLLGQYCCA